MLKINEYFCLSPTKGATTGFHTEGGGPWNFPPPASKSLWGTATVSCVSMQHTRISVNACKPVGVWGHPAPGNLLFLISHICNLRPAIILVAHRTYIILMVHDVVVNSVIVLN